MLTANIVVAEPTIEYDGGVADRTVSRAVRNINGKRLSSSRIILESKLDLDISIKNNSFIIDDIEKVKLINDLNQYSIIIYHEEPNITLSLDIAAYGYENYSIDEISLSLKQTNKYYIYDPILDKKIVRVMNKRQVSQILENANNLYNKGLYNEAILEYDKAIYKDIMCDSAYYGKGRAALKLNDYKCAMDNYQLALYVNHEFSEIYEDIRNHSLYTKAKGSWNTKFYYKKYESIDPFMGNNWLLLGSIANETKFAEYCYKNAVKENPDDCNALFMLGYMQLTFMGDIEGAKDNFIALIDQSDLYFSEIKDVIHEKYRYSSSSSQLKKATPYILVGVDIFEYALTRYRKNKECKEYLKVYYDRLGVDKKDKKK